MAKLTTKVDDVPTGPSLDILTFTEDEKLALLCILGNVRLKAGTPVRSLVKKLEEHFSDDKFEEAFEQFEILVFSDGTQLDPIFVELEVNKK